LRGTGFLREGCADLLLVLGVLGLVVGADAPAGVATPVAGPKANLWVDRSAGSCDRKPTPGSYADSRACGSIAAAYGAAASGDTILVKGGTYGRQVLPSGTKRLTIRNAPGSRPVFGTTSVFASNIRLVGVTIRRNDDPGQLTATLEAKGSKNTFARVHVDSRNMSERQGIAASGDDNVFRGGSTFNVVDEKGVLVGGSRVTFEDFDFHDVRVTDPAVHNECVYSNGPQLTVRRSHFWRCPTMDLFLTRGDWWGQPPYGGVTIENNVFEHSTMLARDSWHHYGLYIGASLSYDGEPLRGLRVRYNTFETSVLLDPKLRATGGSEWVGNVGGGWDCIAGMRYRYNVGQKCSARDKRVSPASSCGPPSCPRIRNARQGWVNPAKHNFRLRAGSPAINAGDPKDFPRVDKDGRLRPVGRRPDAGAYEYRGR
jgi:hypothetical protein